MCVCVCYSIGHPCVSQKLQNSKIVLFRLIAPDDNCKDVKTFGKQISLASKYRW